MLTSKRTTIAVFRRDPLYLLISVIGYDLTASSPAMAVRLYPDAPGDPLLLLEATGWAGADGIRLVEVIVDDDNVPTSVLEVIASKATMSEMPLPGELGSDLTLYYDFQWTPPLEGSGITPVEETVMFGDFIIKGSAND